MKRLTIESLGGEVGCLRLAKEFYARVGEDDVLKPLFPGKSLRCASEEFASFLVQLLDGDSAKYQYRWWVSLRESHARFRISEEQRSRWVELMHAALDDHLAGSQDWKELFLGASLYVIGAEHEAPEFDEWRRQLSLDELIDHIANGRDLEAMEIAKGQRHRPSVFVGVLDRMMRTGRAELASFVLESIESNPEIMTWRYNGRTLLHFAAGAGCLLVVRFILESGVDPDIVDSGEHSALFRVANESGSAEIVQALVEAGADVNHCGGSSKSTPLHAAARRGHLAVAAVLLDAGASTDAVDRRGHTPLDRAFNMRRLEVVRLIQSRM